MSDDGDRVAVLTATVDQLQSEVDELRRRIALTMLCALSLGLVVYTFVVMRGRS